MENATDQKKKRKFNVIDLIFILVIVAVIAVVAWTFIGRTQEKVSTSQYVLTLRCDEIPDYVLSAMKVGDTVQDETGEITLGTITDIKTGPSVAYNPNSDGNNVASNKEGYISLDVTITANAVGSANYITIGGSKYTVYYGFTARCGMARTYFRITSITPAE